MKKPLNQTFHHIQAFSSLLLGISLAACTQMTDPPTPPTPSTTFDETAYALTMGGNALVVFGSAGDARLEVSGLNENTTLLGLDYRPADGLIYLLGSDGQLYTLGTGEGAAAALTVVGTPQDYGGLNGGVAFDVNPQLDALRVIASSDGRNFVTDPDTGITTEYTPSAYESGNPAPKVLATAYNNSVSPFPEEVITTQYSLEAVQNSYAVQAKNEGTLTTLGTLELDLTEFAGLDISGATGTAYALLNVEGVQTLYTVSVRDAALTKLDTDVTGLADLTIVPELP